MTERDGVDITTDIITGITTGTTFDIIMGTTAGSGGYRSTVTGAAGG